MFVDVEGGAVNVKIAVVAREPGAAASFVRGVAERTERSCRGEIVEPRPESGRLVGFDYYVPTLKLETGELAHPHLYALDTRASTQVCDADWAALLHGADAVLRLGATFTSLELALRFAPSAPVHAATVEGWAVAIDCVLEDALERARAASADEPGREAVGFAAVTCPWCHESVEITIEADLSGTFIQDCEVCCRPWTVHVSHDDDGDSRVDIDRA